MGGLREGGLLAEQGGIRVGGAALVPLKAGAGGAWGGVCVCGEGGGVAIAKREGVVIKEVWGHGRRGFSSKAKDVV